MYLQEGLRQMTALKLAIVVSNKAFMQMVKKSKIVVAKSLCGFAITALKNN